MLMCLAALPLAGTICAMTCLSGTTAAAAHHEAGQDCESAMPPAGSGAAQTSPDSSGSSESAAKIGALSTYHCGTHDAALPKMAATDVRRADLAVIAAPAASDPVDPLFGLVATFDSHFRYTPPPDTAPPTTTPLVLRV